MLKFRKNKTYLVSIITQEKIDQLYVAATSSKNAKKMVSDVIINSSLYPFKSKNDFKLACIRDKQMEKREREG